MLTEESRQSITGPQASCDEESLLEVLRITPRQYDPTVARFISEDPIRQASGENNLLTYARNNPINRLDPSGHESDSQAELELKRLEFERELQKHSQRTPLWPNDPAMQWLEQKTREAQAELDKKERERALAANPNGTSSASQQTQGIGTRPLLGEPAMEAAQRALWWDEVMENQRRYNMFQPQLPLTVNDPLGYDVVGNIVPDSPAAVRWGGLSEAAISLAAAITIAPGILTPTGFGAELFLAEHFRSGVDTLRTGVRGQSVSSQVFQAVEQSFGVNEQIARQDADNFDSAAFFIVVAGAPSSGSGLRDAAGNKLDLRQFDTVNMGSGGEAPTGGNVIHVNIDTADLPENVEGARVISDASILDAVPSGQFKLVQANHIPGDVALAKGLVREGYRILQPGGTGTFSSSSLSNIPELMEEAGFKNITKKMAPSTTYQGRRTMPAIEYTGTKPG